MKYLMLTAGLLAALSLSACNKPAVETPPATTIVVPGPAGPQGPQGSTGSQGDAGASGVAGDSTTVIVMPPATTSPAN